MVSLFEPEAVLKDLYGLADVSLTPVQGGYLHRTWRADTSAGPFFVKLYRGRDWPLSQVVPTLEAEDFLAGRGEPVPAVLRSAAGELAVAAADGGVVAVMAFAAGRHLPPGGASPAPAREAGAVLGRVHRALGTLPVSAPPFIPDTAATSERAALLLQEASGKAEPDEMDRLAAEAARYRLESLARRPIDPADYAHARHQVVHGDYYPGNLLFSEAGQVSAVVDFDFCGPRWRGLEVGRAVVEFALSPAGHYHPETARAFLRGYLSENPMGVAERRSMFRLWYDYLLFSLYPLPLRYQGAPLPHGWERLAERRHRLLLWLGAHLGELQSLAASL